MHCPFVFGKSVKATGEQHLWGEFCPLGPADLDALKLGRGAGSEVLPRVVTRQWKLRFIAIGVRSCWRQGVRAKFTKSI